MATINYFAVAFLVLASSCSTGALRYGGASSITPIMKPLINTVNVQYRCVAEIYYDYGTVLGINRFDSGVYELVGSDIPLPLGVENKFTSQNRTTATIPITIAKYSVIVKTGDISLSGCQLARIYRGITTRWEEIPSTKKSGVIIPVMRDGGSGTTQLFTRYLRAACPFLWPQKFVGTGPYLTGNTNIVYVNGSLGVSEFVFANDRAIGYAETNIALISYKNKEVAIQNRNGQRVRSAKYDPYKSIPSALPSTSYESWNAVSLLWKRGRDVYPLVSFVYLFAKGSYKGNRYAFCICNINFLNYLMSAPGQAIAGQDYYTPLPTSIIQKNLAGISKIGCN